MTRRCRFHHGISMTAIAGPSGIPVLRARAGVAMSGGSITVLLEATRAGDETATGRLFAAVYGELKKLARSHRRRWHGNDTLSTTALIHEAYIKLSGPEEQQSFENRTHFYATASKAMRQILINYAERQNAAKRGGDAVRVPLEDEHFVTKTTAGELLDLDKLLVRLETDSPRRCRVVECRVFGGMSVGETAQALSISPATVKRDWQISSAWLYQAMRPEPPPQ